MDWTSRIAGCFGETDLVFAGHAMDEDRAFELLNTLRASNVGFNDTAAAFEKYLMQKGANQDHIDKQLNKLRGMYKPWLLD